MELKVESLSKFYGAKAAVNGVDLKLTPGVWGLIGANGAGKTTLMRMMAGILSPTSGRILYDGVTIKELGEIYRNVLGYLPQSFGFYPEFTVTDYLEYMAALKGLTQAEYRERKDRLLELLTLTEVRKKPIRTLSGGTRRRVGIAQALLNDPDVLLLDEPTAGLDPGERVRLRNFLTGLGRNKMVLISTHIVSDVESAAARNVILKNGRILNEGTTPELLELVKDKVFETVLPSERLALYEREIRAVSALAETEGTVRLRYVSDGLVLPGSEAVPPRLEDLYLWLFQEEKSEAMENA